jgi:choline dehydrogenase-like flavoprotein
MSRTYIPRFLKAGGKLLSGTRAERLWRAGSGWRVELRRAVQEPFELRAEHVFVACGAIQTPALLLRSGLGRNIGRSLNLHPTIKMIARFPAQVNSTEMGVPVHQVKEFAPRISLGCSISSRAYMSLGLLDLENGPELLRSEWSKMASYYAMITPEGVGRVRILPGFNSPLATYQLTPRDRANLADGLKKLGEVLFAAGAVALYPGLNRAKSVNSPKELSELPDEIPIGQGNLMTIHLFSSCPMGEDRERCAADSWGRVHGYENLHVADASLLCSAPGVNPQGTIMALAHRNAQAFLNRI